MLRAGTIDRRRRATRALCAGTVVMNAAMGIASAVSTIVAGDQLGTTWAAVPNTAGVIGTGLGALLLSRGMNRWGRRVGLLLGYGLAAAGGLAAALAAIHRDAVGLCVGLLLLGIGNAGAQLSRYAAAEMYPSHRRGQAIGVVVWAATLGAVGGPLLIAPTAALGGSLGWPGPVCAFLAAAACCALGVVAGFGAPAGAGVRDGVPGVRPGRLLRVPAARSALLVMACAQVVMVGIMTAAPLDMHHHGAGLGVVGAVLSAHTLGMFVLSPVTGRLVDRFGARPVMASGLATLVLSSAVAAFGEGDPLRMAALFLLGYGWNLCFVGGSGQITRQLPAADRMQIEGAVDAAVWGAAAVASLASTAILAAGGFAALGVVGGVLAVLPLALLVRRR
ncbi:MFS transporter [Saccharopolyspora shandongensis]|uniref:MFS transporter n=1 Tax=Saccharopolyspora shandongensis TaxID=418495 RepID=UPI003439B3B4